MWVNMSGKIGRVHGNFKLGTSDYKYVKYKVKLMSFPKIEKEESISCMKVKFERVYFNA